jgi:hypothetical protein
MRGERLRANIWRKAIAAQSMSAIVVSRPKVKRIPVCAIGSLKPTGHNFTAATGGTCTDANPGKVHLADEVFAADGGSFGEAEAQMVGQAVCAIARCD